MKRLIFTSVLGAMVATYLAMVLWSLPKLTAVAGGLTMFDLRPGGYSFEQAHEVVLALGEAGRAFYLGPQHMLDTAYPVLMALALGMAFSRLYGRKLALAGLSGLAAGFDLMENMAVSVMLKAGPEGLNAGMVDVASRWTVLKSGAVSAAMLALIAGLAMATWRRHARRGEAPT